MEKLSSTVASLNDNCFVIATESLAELARAFEEEMGRLPKVDELAEILLWGMKSSSTELFADAACVLAQSVKIRVRKAVRHTLKRGDIFAIPRAMGGFFPAVFLANNGTFGEAYGFFYPVDHCRPPIDLGELRPIREAVYCDGGRAVKEGQWQYIDSVPEAADLFDSDVPMYRKPGSHPDGLVVTGFGMALYSDGRKRELTEEEAEYLGLIDGSYKSVSLSERVLKLIEYRLKKLSAGKN